MRQKDSCTTCLKGRSTNINTDILCIEKGIVSDDYICLKYRKMPPINFINSIIKGYHCVDCKYFIKSDCSDKESFGLCQLFTIREYNGTNKSACSKFIKDKL